jgi:hypothetical protein
VRTHAEVEFWVNPKPTATIDPVTPAVRTTPPAEVRVRFSEPVHAPSLEVRRDGLLAAAPGVRMAPVDDPVFDPRFKLNFRLIYRVTGLPEAEGRL